MNEKTLNFFSCHGKFSHPQIHIKKFQQIPLTIEGMCKTINGLLLHEADYNLFKIVFSPQRLNELNLRTLDAMLTKIFELDGADLKQERHPKKRLISSCRDFAFMLVAMCRQMGIPARMRIGFTEYGYGLHSVMNDHVVAEYWNTEENRWIKVDARISEWHIANKVFPIDFNPFDVPDNKFISVADVWLKCRNNNDLSKSYGTGKNLEFSGLWYIRNRLIQDFNALCKCEMLNWDLWGYMLTSEPLKDPVNLQELTILDNLALIVKNKNFSIKELREFFKNPNLKVGNSIKSFPKYSKCVEVVNL